MLWITAKELVLFFDVMIFVKTTCVRSRSTGIHRRVGQVSEPAKCWPYAKTFTHEMESGGYHRLLHRHDYFSTHRRWTMVSPYFMSTRAYCGTLYPHFIIPGIWSTSQQFSALCPNTLSSINLDKNTYCMKHQCPRSSAYFAKSVDSRR